MKKFLVLLLTVALMLTATTAMAEGLKVGVILVGDETEGYSLAHMNGIEAAGAELGLEVGTDIIYKKKIEETSECLEAAEDLFDQGCNIVISNSYGHQDFMDQAAAEFDGEDVVFVSMTGDYAGITGKTNFKNAFTRVYESRYVSGVVAGMKVAELLSSGELTAETQPNSFDENGNVKIGYVGAFPYAEVVSGYTAFYLGLTSVCPNAVMEVKYTNSWFDVSGEAAAAEALVANGCVIIGQHADSTGAPSAVQKLLDAGTICYSVGYNVDMLDVAPTAALTSASNNWSAYYSYLFNAVQNGEEVTTDWSEGYAMNAVAITTLGPSCAAGTEEKVTEVIAALSDGSLKVFDTATFTVTGANVDTTNNNGVLTTDENGVVTSFVYNTTYMDWSTMTAVYEGQDVECIADGAFEESVVRSAPYFCIRIDGITEDAE